MTKYFVFTVNNVIKSVEVERTMHAVDRGNYVINSPYLDQPQSIGYGVTISAPHMVFYYIFIIKYYTFSFMYIKFYIFINIVDSR